MGHIQGVKKPPKRNNVDKSVWTPTGNGKSEENIWKSTKKLDKRFEDAGRPFGDEQEVKRNCGQCFWDNQVKKMCILDNSIGTPAGTEKKWAKVLVHTSEVNSDEFVEC